MKKRSLELVVFFSGACLMVLEIVGSRIFSPYVGTSTAVWTILIGVILGFLSLGYHFGGKYADSKASLETLSNIILLSSVSIFLIALVNKPILNFIVKNTERISFASILGAIILFSAPSFLLGIVSPYATRLRLKTLKKLGTTVGNLYAISTLGSIVGTFLAGFFLIPFLGTIKILYLITIVLVFASIVAKPPRLFSKKTFLIFVFFCVLVLSYFQFIKNNQTVDIDTAYNRVSVYRFIGNTSKRPIVTYKTDPFGYQGAMFTDSDNDLVFRYLKYFRLADYFNPNIKRALVIGGGAYSYPKRLFIKTSHGKIRCCRD